MRDYIKTADLNVEPQLSSSKSDLCIPKKVRIIENKSSSSSSAKDNFIQENKIDNDTSTLNPVSGELDILHTAFLSNVPKDHSDLVI